jgi:hypothetical protein
MESSCKLGNEPSGSIKCWELPSGYTTRGLSCGTQLQTVSSFGNLFAVVGILCQECEKINLPHMKRAA